MADQATLIPPVIHGLWKTVARARAIDDAAWRNAVHEAAFVGHCACGGYLAPLPAYHLGQRADYEAQCRSCGAVVCAPGGRLGLPRKG